MLVAIILTIGFIIGLGALSLTTGGMIFLFGRPRLNILKSSLPNGLAFSFKWDQAGEPAKFDLIKLRLFNPFGSPSQIEVSQVYPVASEAFARDIEFGPGFEKILKTKELNQSTIQIELLSSKDGISYQFDMSGAKFAEKLKLSKMTAENFNEKRTPKKPKAVFHTVKRSFIADSLPATENKTLKIATNPEFTNEFSGDTGAGPVTQEENFTVSKVWIEDGCIVCDACEAIYPEVFEVQADTCIIKADAPLNDGLKIIEAAEACPVEVIKFSKA